MVNDKPTYRYRKRLQVITHNDKPIDLINYSQVGGWIPRLLLESHSKEWCMYSCFNARHRRSRYLVREHEYRLPVCHLHATQARPDKPLGVLSLLWTRSVRKSEAVTREPNDNLVLFVTANMMGLSCSPTWRGLVARE